MLIYRFKQLLLVFGDFVSFILAFLLSITLRYFKIPDWEKIKFHLLLFLIVYIFWIIVNYINGLYDLGRLTNDRSFYRRFSETAIISLIISITFFYLFPDKQIAPKTILLANIFLGYGISAIWRLSFQKILGAEALKNNLIFVGFTNETKELIDILNKEPEKGYEVKALIDPTNEVKPITYKFVIFNT